MRYLTILIILVILTFFGTADGDAAPQLEGSARNYTLVFAGDGEISKRDVCEDPAATIVGKAGTIVSTGQNGVHVLRGTAVLTSAKKPIKITFGSGLEGALQEHSRVAIARRGSRFDLMTMSGAMTVCLPNRQQQIKEVGTMTLSTTEPLTLAPSTTRVEVEFADHPDREEPIRLLASNGTQFNAKGNTFQVIKGTAFVQLPSRVELVTPGGIIRSAKPYMVSYRMVGDCLCIENCTPCDAITLDVRGEELKLDPFSGCVLKHCQGQSAALPEDGILRRNLHVKTDGVFTAMVAEYDPLTLLESHEELRRTVKNPVTAHDQHISDSIFKGIAVWQELCGGVESFSSELKVRNVEMLGYFKNPIKFAAKYELLK